MSVFRSAFVFEKVPAGKGKDKSSIECLEYFYNNLYVGCRDGLVQHFSVSGSSSGSDSGFSSSSGPGCLERAVVREVGRRQMGRSGPVSQLKTVPVLNLLLVLWDGSVSALNMFSLEPVPGLKRIQNVSAFNVREPAAHTAAMFVELFAASIAGARRRAVSVYKVCVDRWECVGLVALSQDPVALAVQETCVCVATSDRYLLHDYRTQSHIDLFPHKLPKQNIVVRESGEAEFLLNGPGNLGMFVMKSGISQRPPIPWCEGVLDAVVQFPYMLALQSRGVHVYSMLDQQLKQVIPLQNAKALLPTTDSVFVLTEREIHRLSQNPLQDQIQCLLGNGRVDEALMLLDGAQTLLPADSYKSLYSNVICTAAWIKFYREDFAEAKDLFVKGELDPREIISLYPTMTVFGKDASSLCPAVSNAKDLHKLCEEDRKMFLLYLNFLKNYLMEIRKTPQGEKCPQDVDTALFKLYLEQGDYDQLDQFVKSPNHCSLQVCIPELQQQKRFFTVGLLYQNQGQYLNAIQNWVKMVDEKCEESSHVLQHIVKTLCSLNQKSISWKFIDWILQKDQEVGVLILTKRNPDEQSTFETEEGLTILEHYPVAMTLYLEFLVHQLQSTEEKHHTLLAVTYATQILQTPGGEMHNGVHREEMRVKLQELLWQSSIYKAEVVYAIIKSSTLHEEKAIVLGRTGEHRKALQLLVHENGDNIAAENYCRRTSAGQSKEFMQLLFLSLLQVYLESEQHLTAAVDLLNGNAASFNLAQVLQVLPESWSLQLVVHFLGQSLRARLHQSRTRGLEKSLTIAQNLRHKQAWMEATRVKVKMDRSRVCHSCQRQLDGSEFLRWPAGQLFHTHCYTPESLNTVNSTHRP